MRTTSRSTPKSTGWICRTIPFTRSPTAAVRIIIPWFLPTASTSPISGFDDKRLGYQATQLYVMDSDGSHSRSLTPALDRDAAAPHWTRRQPAADFSIRRPRIDQDRRHRSGGQDAHPGRRCGRQRYHAAVFRRLVLASPAARTPMSVRLHQVRAARPAGAGHRHFAARYRDSHRAQRALLRRADLWARSRKSPSTRRSTIAASRDGSSSRRASMPPRNIPCCSRSTADPLRVTGRASPPKFSCTPRPAMWCCT